MRAHRERLLPPATEGRRRTPGLRREELAARAGISTTWCAWIEQGRQVQASSDALRRLAAALGLTDAERAYLFELAGQIDPVARARSEFEQVPPSLAEAVRSLDHPAYGLDRLWNVCCYNSRTDGLFRGWLGRASDRNLLRFVFLDPAARELIPNWEERARRLSLSFAQISCTICMTTACTHSSPACQPRARSSRTRGIRRTSSTVKAATGVSLTSTAAR